MAPRKRSSEPTLPKVHTDDNFRRTDDLERLAKLEYVVYEDHDPLLVSHAAEIKTISDNQAAQTRHLKNIRNMIGAFLIGTVFTQIGWEKALKIASMFLI